MRFKAKHLPGKIVIIGAGIGGLTVAALLAKAGFDVTVLESHVDPGGCAATFYHQGYRFDAGATLVGGFQPGGPHHHLGHLLGIEWPVHPIEPAMEVGLPDRHIRRYGDTRWLEEVRRVFPETSALRFWRDQAQAADRLWKFATFISVSALWDRTRAPIGQRTITITTHTQAQTWWDWQTLLQTAISKHGNATPIGCYRQPGRSSRG